MLGPEWKYHITIETPDWYEAQMWCQIYVGEFNVDWYKLGIDPMDYVDTGRTKTKWYFKREEDIILFSLRWQ
jgi:hypothetical protein